MQGAGVREIHRNRRKLYKDTLSYCQNHLKGAKLLVLFTKSQCVCRGSERGGASAKGAKKGGKAETLKIQFRLQDSSNAKCLLQ